MGYSDRIKLVTQTVSDKVAVRKNWH
jgi:hypothetical protein